MITYERLYYSDVETLTAPPPALVEAAEQAIQMMPAGRVAVWYAKETQPSFLERTARGNPCFRVTVQS